MGSINSFYTPSVLMRTTTLGQNMRLRDSVNDLNSRIAKLTEQQTSGRWATTHGDLRSQSTLVQGLRQKSNTLDGYLRTLGQVGTRVEAQQGAADILQKAADGLGISGMVALNSDAKIQLQQIPREAFGTVERMITALNTSIEGRYLFGGADTQTRPVADLATILDGKAGKVGLKQAAANRLLADLGAPIDSATTNPDGRVSVSRTGTRVTVEHDGGAFGLKLQSASLPTSGMTATAPTTGVERTANGSRLDVDFGTVAAGDQMVLTFQLPTGETLDVTMMAATTLSSITPEGVVEFEIDPTDPTATAGNFVNALQDKILDVARGELAGASAMAAANDFFDFYPPRMVAGTDPANATTFDISGARSVEWYAGPQGPRPTADSTVIAAYSGVAQGDGTGLPNPAEIGQRYFVDPATEGSAGAGAWSGHANEYAVWDGTAWTFSAVTVGDRMVGGTNFGASAGQVLEWDGAAWATVAAPFVQDGDRVVVAEGARHADEGKVMEYNGGTWSVVTDQPETVLDIGNNRVGHFDGKGWNWTTAEDGYEMVVGSGNSAMLYRVETGAWTPRGRPVEQPSNARDTMTAKIDDNTWVSYGARANEDGFRNALKSAAILAAVKHDADRPEHYHALTSRAAPSLKSAAANVIDTRTAIGVTEDRLQVTLDRHEDVKSLTDQQTLRIEEIDGYQVATELNNLMTQLQGTYSITAKLQQLSLVNFL